MNKRWRFFAVTMNIESTVLKAELMPHSLKFKHGKTYQSAVTVMKSVEHRLLHLSLDNGLTAIGEVARYPLYNTIETQELEDAALLDLMVTKTENMKASTVPQSTTNFNCRNVRTFLRKTRANG